MRLDTLTVSEVRGGKLSDRAGVSYSNFVGVQRYQSRFFWIGNQCSSTNAESCLFGEENLSNSGKVSAREFSLDPKLGNLINVRLANISEYPILLRRPENFNLLASKDTVNISWSSAILPFQGEHSINSSLELVING